MMHLASKRIAGAGAILGLVAAFVLIQAERAQAANKPTDQIFPNTTKGYLSAADTQALLDQWDETQLGKLVDDPLMKPFVDDLRDQIKKERSKDGIDWALTWDDVQELARGESAVALIHTPGKRPAIAMLVDVTGTQNGAVTVLNRIFQSLTAKAATWKKETVADRELTIFNLPRSAKDPHRPPQVAYFIKNNFVGAIDDAAVARKIMERMDANATDSLSSLANYQKVVKRCEADVALTKAKQPGARWFVQPVDYAQARRVIDPKFFMSDKIDMIRVMKNAGFAAIQAVGGYVHLRTGEYDLLNRMAVYAPPPYEKSMKMLDTPNSGPFPPFDWLPADVASYTSGGWDVRTAVNNIEALYDETVGNGDQGVWRDALRSIREDKEGPRIDMEKRLFPHLGTRLTRISDVRKPITTQSERNLMIIDLRDAKEVQAALEQYYAKDPLATKKKAGEHVYWEIEPEETDEEFDVPALQVQNPALAGGNQNVAGGVEKTEPSGLAVAHDKLLVASHVSLLSELLEGKPKQTLAEDPQYQRVSGLIKSEIEKRSWDKTCLWRFVRSEAAYEPTYELTRMGKLPLSKSMIGEAINMLAEPGPGGKPRKQKADGSKLPPYDKVSHYLTPFGGLGIREDGQEFQGWFFVSFGLSGDEGK
jgi:hypothetical protein